MKWTHLKSRHGIQPNRRSTHGVAALEFLFAAPAFFVLVFFICEISLVWSDRHLMRLAAYRVGRLVVKMRSESGGAAGGNLCWAVPPNATGQIDKDILKASRRSAAKVMAPVTPTVSQLMSMFGSLQGPALESSIAGEFLHDFGTQVTGSTVAQQLNSNPYVHSIFRMVTGLPAAWMFIELQCTNIEYPTTPGIIANKGVEIKLVYHRSAKMPYVGTMMWMLRRIQEFYTSNQLGFDGASEMVRVNPLNYGIEFAFKPNDALFQQKKDELTTAITDTLAKKTTELAGKVSTTIAENLPATANDVDLLGQATAHIFQTDVKNALDSKIGSLATTYQNEINTIGQAGLNIFVTAPQELKTIPVTVSVRIPNYNESYVNAGHDWQGKAVLIGNFTSGENMTKLARKMGEVIDVENPPNSPNKGLPYTKVTGGQP